MRKVILEDFASIAKGKVVEQKLHPIQIASRLKKPNKIAIPYGQWEQGFLFITWYTPWADAAECVEIYCNKMEEYKENLQREGTKTITNLKPLQDDYAKFIRFAQWKVKQKGCGIVAYITNSHYIDGLIFRGMRYGL